MANILYLIGSICFVVGAVINMCNARDLDGKYAQQDPKKHEWFESLRSGKGPCCSDADGTAVSDADWETTPDGKHYRVKIEGEWIDVPDDAVLTVPNEYGRTVVWPIRGYLGISIRCFIPGAGG